MEGLFEKAQAAAEFISNKINHIPKTAIVLGTGLSDIIEKELQSIPYRSIPHFPSSTVVGHKGQLIIAKIGGKEVLVLSGRYHHYEGYSTAQVSFPVRVLKALGIQKLLITNVTGGLNADYDAGDVVFVEDHINLLPENPLRGLTDERLGIRFTDMLHAYDQNLLARAKDICASQNIPFKKGVYVCLQGPSLETRAEYKFLHIIGGDMVGMSTVPEVIVAKQCEIPTLVMSCISNVCYPIDRITETTVEEVIEVAKKASKKMGSILNELV